MKGDFSRSTFDRKKHYSSVLMQQGRIQLDSDWNEHLDIEVYLRQLRANDIIGFSGAPKWDAGFEVQANGNDLTLSAGRLYVDGILCENEAEVFFTTQPDWPAASRSLPGTPGLYLAYLDVWQRHLTALEDPHLREVALGGPETTTRLKVVWQLKLQRLTQPADSLICKELGPGWRPTVVETTGSLSVRAEAGATPDNSLYRVEIHAGSDNSQGPTFKWSRDNGTAVGRIEKITGQIITVSQVGCLPETAFAPGQWVELSDEARALNGEPGIFVRLLEVQGDALTMAAGPAAAVTLDDLGPLPTVRRWDSLDGAVPFTVGSEIALEHGLFVKFGEGTYRSGDYWMFPARALTRDVEWPRDSSGPLPQPPQGVEHHYCRLALLDYKADQTFERKEDCRFIFSSLADLKELNAVQADLNAPDGSIYIDGLGNVKLLAGTAINEFSTDPTLADASDSAVPTEQAVKAYVDNLLVGSVAAFAMETPPAGWRECNGDAIPRTDYARLFNKIGTKFGAGDGANTFNVPDLRGKFVRGWAHDSTSDPDRDQRTASGSGGASGNKVGSYQEDGLQKHIHNFAGNRNSTESKSVADTIAKVVSGKAHIAATIFDGSDHVPASSDHGHDFTPSGTITEPTTGRVSSESRPKNVYLMYCIKF